MIATLEISMYPLTDNYSDEVIAFIQRIKQEKKLRVEVNGLSTQIFGEYDLLMSVITAGIKTVFETGRAIFVLKIGANELSKEKLPEILK